MKSDQQRRSTYDQFGHQGLAGAGGPPGFDSPLQPEPIPEPREPPPPPPRGWTYWDVAILIAFAFGSQIIVLVGAMVAMLLLRQARGGTFTYLEAMSSAPFVLSAQFLWWLAIFWVVYRIVRARDPRPFREAIGWTRPARPPAFYLAGGALLALSVALLAWALPMPRQKMPMEMLFRDPKSAFLLAGFGILFAPLAEELLFRGFLFPVMQRAHGTVIAILATGSLFSLVHAQQYGWAWQNLLLLSYVGAAFGALRAVTGSLVPCTLAHAAYNFCLFAGLFAASNRFHNF